MRILASALVILVGIVLLIGFGPVADDIADIISGLSGTTDFESAVFHMWKYILLVLVFVGALVALVGPKIMDIFRGPDNR